MSARMTMQEAVRYLTERDRGCTIYNGSTIYVFHRKQQIGVLQAERGFPRGSFARNHHELTVPSLTVAKLAETEAA